MNQFGGSQKAAYNAVLSATKSEIQRLGITAGQYEFDLTVAGVKLGVRGVVVDGVVKIGTFLRPKFRHPNLGDLDLIPFFRLMNCQLALEGIF
ncbi:MAG: hypothetical protein HQM08_25705 [Candidatus Riflebacteria bacterium]|nr:hypothetical protein [Candidatus Riflebacteria bacterium]